MSSATLNSVWQSLLMFAHLDIPLDGRSRRNLSMTDETQWPTFS